jgi:3-hydroxyacyl-CoA dehydrogenase
MPYQIKRVAVIGAGTMGAAIAGLVAGAGLPVLLLDVPPSTLTPDEEAKGLRLDHPAVRNRIVKQGFDRMRNARPANLFSAASAALISLGNTEDDFDKLADCDWILEAIVEKIAPKQDLMARIAAVRKSGALVTSNTSGIPIGVIAEGRDEDFRRHFFGTHFFNPPRYLKLLEIIPGADSDSLAVEAMCAFAENTLGKGVVICKDRPNFIGNRLGTFSAMSDLRFILDKGYTVEEVDALTGPLIGRPNTATFRLLDLAGNDIMAYVADNLYEAIPDDESRETFRSTDLLQQLVAAGRLGKKVNQGFYKETKVEGKREFWPLDLQTLDYVPPQGSTSVQGFGDEMKAIKELPARLRAMLQRASEQPDDRGAQLVAQTLLPVMSYAARRLPEIADSVADVDNAMRWGFAHELGPFQIWDALGLAETSALMEARDIEVAGWVKRLVADGETSFYKEADGQQLAYDVAQERFVALPRHPLAIDLAELKAQGKEIAGNQSAGLIDIGEGVLCFELRGKANTIDGYVLELAEETLQILQDERWVGLVIGNQGTRFSAGANLRDLATPVEFGDFDTLNELLQAFHAMMQAFRFSPKPVVTAPFGQTLGGGAELTMTGARTVAAAETYIGLVEFGVGLIPGAGGCKELNRRIIAEAARKGGDTLKAFQRVFETISLAKVATSALEARELGYLRDDDVIVFNQNLLIGAARQEVLTLAASNYEAPANEASCYAMGRDALAAARVAIYQMVQGGYASEYDAFIADKLAYVLAGGELSSPQFVEEQYILDLERAMFVELARQEKTQARARAMLETGKPLRN